MIAYLSAVHNEKILYPTIFRSASDAFLASFTFDATSAKAF